MNVKSKMKAVFDSLGLRSFKGLITLPIVGVLLIYSFVGQSPLFAKTKPEAIDCNNMAVDKLHKSDYKGALKDLDEAIRIDPNYALAYSNRIIVKDATNDSEGAIADFEKLIRIYPSLKDIETLRTAARAYYRRGVIKYGQRDYRGAINDYDKAIELNPTEVQYYKERALAKQKQGDEKGAAEDLFNVKQLQ